MEYITKYLEGGPRVQYPECVIERVQQQWPSQFDSEEYNEPHQPEEFNDDEYINRSDSELFFDFLSKDINNIIQIISNSV